MRKLWASFRAWLSVKLATPSNRIGVVVAGLGAGVWYADQHGDPPVYLTGALTLTFGAWLAAVGADKQRQTQETAATADRAEAKADAAGLVADSAESKADELGRVAVHHHPESAGDLTPPLPPKVTGGST